MKTATKPKPEALPRAGEDARSDGTVLAQLAALQRLSVDSVSFSGGSIYMLLQDGSTRAYNDVLAFM